MFADLAGFTTFSETRPPTEVHRDAQRVLGGGRPGRSMRRAASIEHFAGDGVMAIFNADGDQPDHARRAATAGPATIVEAGRPLADAHPGWPVFRVGVNTGPAVVGNVGVAGRRSFAVIGDTTNVAARLMAAGEPGEVVVGRATWEALGAGRDGVGARADSGQGQARAG